MTRGPSKARAVRKLRAPKGACNRRLRPSRRQKPRASNRLRPRGDWTRKSGIRTTQTACGREVGPAPRRLRMQTTTNRRLVDLPRAHEPKRDPPSKRRGENRTTHAGRRHGDHFGRVLDRAAGAYVWGIGSLGESFLPPFSNQAHARLQADHPQSPLQNATKLGNSTPATGTLLMRAASARRESRPNCRCDQC